MKPLATTTTLLLALVAALVEAAAGELEGPAAPPDKIVTLAEAQELAARRSPSARNLDELVYQADMDIRRAWAMLLPHLSAKGSVTRNKDEVALQFPDFSAFDPADPTAPLPTSQTVIQEKWGQAFGFTANMTLFDPRSVPLIKNTHDYDDLSRLTARRLKNDLLYAVTAAYYQVHSMQELIGVAEKNLSLAEELEQVSAERKEAGLGNKIDLLRAELQVVRARKELDNARDADRLARSALAETIAERSETEIKMRWLPAFDVTYDWSWSSAEGFAGEHDSWMLIFGARWSLFEGGGRIAELKAVQSRTRMAQNDLEQLRLDIRAEVEQAYIEVGRQRRNVEIADVQNDLAEENLTLVDKQYRAGAATSLDALDAATELHNQRVARVLERLRYDVAMLSLSKAIGEYHSLAAVEPR